jgi:hypothetical protein
MEGRIYNVQLDLEVHVTDWPVLAEACRAAGRDEVDRAEYHALLDDDPLVGFVALALAALDQGIPGARLELYEAGEASFSGWRRDDDGSDVSLNPWPPEEDDDDGGGAGVREPRRPRGPLGGLTAEADRDVAPESERE